MFSLVPFFFALALGRVATAAPAVSSAACSSYTIIDTRGTTELQGPSIGFRSMNQQILSQVSGGREHDTVYLAGVDQNSALATLDIVNTVKTTLASDPDHCFFLEGYSQGAAATVDALASLTDGATFDAVRGVFLIGNPRHQPGLSCNVDEQGGRSTRETRGLESLQRGIPQRWVSKTRDLCLSGDAVCDSPFGSWATHLTYGYSPEVQKYGAKFGVAVLDVRGE